MLKGRIIIKLALLLLVGFACKPKSDDLQLKEVVRVHDNSLTINEIKAAVPNGISKADSVEYAEQYIKTWITQELTLEKALYNVPKNDEELERLVKDYKNALIVKKYRELLVNSKADVTPSEAEIDSFYHANIGDYVLKEDIVSGVYFKLPQNAPNQNSLQNWLKELDEDNRLSIEDYCLQNAAVYDDFSEEWIAKAKINRFFPQRLPRRLAKGSVVAQADSVFQYYLMVLNVKQHDDTAPLLFTEENIVKLLRHKKKLDYIKTFEKELYDEGIKNENILYNPHYK